MQSPQPFSRKSRRSRRTFLKVAGAGTLATSLPFMNTTKAAAQEQLAMNGGPKAVTAGGASGWPLYGEAEEKAVLNIVRSPGYGNLPQVEEDWRTHFGAKYAKSHCNGTGALTSMFFALTKDLPPGSEIMVPSYTFFATIVPMRMFGFVPVFVDINPQTLNFDLNDAKKKLTANTKAMLPVHWIGLPCDMDQICDFAEEKGLVVLEDAAHAQGAKLKGRFTGTWGRMGIFSFQASKALPGIEGGMGTYQEKDDYDRATAYGHYSKCEGNYAKYNGTGLGVKLRMHPMAAALVRAQIPIHFERMAACNKQIRSLNDRLTQLPGLLEQTSNRSDVDRIHYSWNMMFIDEKEAGMTRAQAVKALQAEGVSTSNFGYTLQHEKPLYAEAQWWHHAPVVPSKEELPGTYKANEWALPLPCFTSEAPELCDQYVKAFEKVWAHREEIAKT